MAAFDATDITNDPRAKLGECPHCGAVTERTYLGGITLCLPCTVKDLGETLWSLAIRTEFHLSRKAFETRLEKYGPPHLNLKEWITPRARLKR